METSVGVLELERPGARGFVRGAFGTLLATGLAVGVRRLEDLVAFRLAVEFKLEVYRLVRQHPSVTHDLRYRSQLQDAASGIEANLAEGWRRYRSAELAQFARYALASLEEARRRLDDGVHRGHFPDAACTQARLLAGRCSWTLLAFVRAVQRLGKTPHSPKGPN